jgi:hypothetical protein
MKDSQPVKIEIDSEKIKRQLLDRSGWDSERHEGWTHFKNNLKVSWNFLLSYYIPLAVGALAAVIGLLCFQLLGLPGRLLSWLFLVAFSFGMINVIYRIDQKLDWSIEDYFIVFKGSNYKQFWKTIVGGAVGLWLTGVVLSVVHEGFFLMLLSFFLEIQMALSVCVLGAYVFLEHIENGQGEDEALRSFGRHFLERWRFYFFVNLFLTALGLLSAVTLIPLLFVFLPMLYAFMYFQFRILHRAEPAALLRGKY